MSAPLTRLRFVAGAAVAVPELGRRRTAIGARLARAERTASVLARPRRWSGGRARHPRDMFAPGWAQQQRTRGCPVWIPAVGSLVAHGRRLRGPAGRIHWAGTETATCRNGCMGGAVSSGERASAEVKAAL